MQPQNPMGVDPRLIEAIARGSQGQSKMGAMAQNPQMIKALRDYNTPIPGMTGQGRTAQAPNPLQMIGAMLLRNKGSNALDELGNQQQSIHQDIGQAAGSEVTAGIQQNQFELNKETEALNLQRQIDNTKYAANLKTWIGPDGEKVNAARSKGGGYIDANRNPINLDGYMTEEDKLKTQEVNALEFGKAPKAMITEAQQGWAATYALNDINAAARKLTKRDIKELNKPFLTATIKAFTPQAWEQYVLQNKTGRSQAVKDYLAQIDAFAANIRHNYFGSALTMTEKQLAEAFLPSATGLNLEDRNQRVDLMFKGVKQKLQATQGITGAAVWDNAPKYRPFDIETTIDPDRKAILDAEVQRRIEAAKKIK